MNNGRGRLHLAIVGVAWIAAATLEVGCGPAQAARSPAATQTFGSRPSATAPEMRAPPTCIPPPPTSACAGGYRWLNPANYERGQPIAREVAVQWQLPTTVRFEAATAARLNPYQQLILEGVLINDAMAPQQIVVFPVAGALTPSGAFHVVIAADPRIGVVQSGPPRPPPAPPPPLRFELPGCSPLPLKGAVSLTDLQYSPGISTWIEWTYLHWSGRRPSGRIGVTLP